MNGLHLIADLYGCRCELALLKEQQLLQSLCVEACREAGLTVLGDYFFQFRYDNGEAAGVTGTVVLAESHLAIHTWPEDRNITLDVYVCNYSRDNSALAKAVFDRLIDRFAPVEAVSHRVVRGHIELPKGGAGL